MSLSFIILLFVEREKMRSLSDTSRSEFLTPASYTHSVAQLAIYAL